MSIEEVLYYDDNDGTLKWMASAGGRIQKGKIAGSPHGNGYLRVRYQGASYFVHRVVWYLEHGDWPIGLVDHIDGDKSNNKISNLRIATHTQNHANSVKRHGKNRYKGVGKLRGSSLFYASIKSQGTRHHLGSFETEEDAARAYDVAAEYHFGPFAKTNKMLGLLYC